MKTTLRLNRFFSRTLFVSAFCFFAVPPQENADARVSVSVSAHASPDTFNSFNGSNLLQQTDGSIRTPDQNYADGVSFANQKSYAQAVSFFQAAASSGHAKAQYALGYCYAVGLGVQVNNEIADYWIRAAVEQGSPEIFYTLSEGAKSGNFHFQYFLGYSYFSAKGVARNYPLAAQWFTAAAAQNHPKAKQALDYMRKNNLIPPAPPAPPPPPVKAPAPPAKPPAQAPKPQAQAPKPPAKTPAPPAKQSLPPSKGKSALKFGDFNAAPAQFSINEVPRPATGEILHTSELIFKNGTTGRLSFILTADRKNLRAVAVFLHKLPDDFPVENILSFDPTPVPVNISGNNTYALFDDMVKIKNLAFRGGAVSADVSVVYHDVHSEKNPLNAIGEIPVSFAYFVGKASANAPTLIYVRPKNKTKTPPPVAKTTTVKIRVVDKSKPLAQRKVHLIGYDSETKKWTEEVQTTAADGLASFRVPILANGESRSFFVEFSQEKITPKIKLADNGDLPLYRVPPNTPVLELEVPENETEAFEIKQGSVKLWSKE
ncbi:MAG: sel1 repeat family protein [Puniceicoccales bacterium]|nr:sel1 repeat family protein [Puniceicoccales bacterium]